MTKARIGIVVLAAIGIGAGVGIAQAQDTASKASAANTFSALESGDVSSAVPSGPLKMLSDMAGTTQPFKAKRLFVGTGSLKKYSIYATRQGDGGMCIDGSYIGGCFAEFPANGVVFTTAMNTDGVVGPNSKQLISGVVSDRVSSLAAKIRDQQIPIALQNGAFVYVVSDPGIWVDEVIVSYVDGSTESVVIDDPNRPAS